MQNIILQLITAALGSLGFGMLFHLRPRLLAWAALGGFLCWGAYLLFHHWIGTIFMPSVLASAAAALYAELLARTLKAPATLFMIPSVVPMIPGSTLYYTMSHAVRGEWELARSFGSQTIQYALGIAIGASLVWAFWVMQNNVVRKRRS